MADMIEHWTGACAWERTEPVRMDTAPQEPGSSLSGSQSGAPKRAGRARRYAEIFRVGQHLLRVFLLRCLSKLHNINARFSLQAYKTIYDSAETQCRV